MAPTFIHAGSRGGPLRPSGSSTVPTNVRPYRVGSGTLRVVGALMCILGTMIAAVLPVLAYIFVWHTDDRARIEAYTHWGIIGFAGLLGLIALLSNSAFMLALHVILGAMLGAALSAHNENIFLQQQFKCSQLQAASAGCGNECGNCALLNTCSAHVIATSCPTCQAYPAEFCNNLASNRIIIGIIGAVTLFALAVPSVLSLLVLLRNEAARGIEGSKLEWVRARVEEQCKLLEDGLPLTFPLDALLGSVQRLESSGEESNQALANRCKLDLAKAGFNVPAAPGTDEIKAGQAFIGAERATLPDANDAGAVPLVAWTNQNGPQKAAITPNRSSTPTNVVYPVVEPGYTPPPIETSSTPLLGGPGTVFVSSAVTSKTIVSERSTPEAGVEGEDETPSKERKHRHKHHKHREASDEAGAEGEDSGEKKRRHRKKREEEDADAV
ncbi:hypothetical protein WJX82_006262 [Trebouxia sp. C0006]